MLAWSRARLSVAESKGPIAKGHCHDAELDSGFSPVLAAHRRHFVCDVAPQVPFRRRARVVSFPKARSPIQVRILMHGAGTCKVFALCRVRGTHPSNPPVPGHPDLSPPSRSAPLSELDANTPCSRTGDLPPLPACSPSAGQMQGAGRCSADTLWGHVRRSNPFGCSHDWAGDTPGAPPADERLLPPALTEAPSSRGFAWDAASETHRGDPGVASDPEAPLQGSPALPDIGAVCATPAIGDAAMGRDNERCVAWDAWCHSVSG